MCVLLALETRPAAADRAADRDLAKAAAAGDPRAQRDLVRRLLPRVRSLVRYLVADSPDAPDLVQISLVAVLRSAGSFRGESRLETWVDRIVVRTVMRQIQQSRRRLDPVSPEVVEAQRCLEPGPGEQVDCERVRQRMAALLGRISAERRLVLVLHLVLGHSVREIAEMTETREHTVWDRLKKGKRELRAAVVADDVLRHFAGQEAP